MFAIENIAEGFAGSIVAVQADWAISGVLERIGGDREFCCKYHFVKEDEDGMPISGGSYWRTMLASDFLGAVSTFWNRMAYQYEADDFAYIKDWADFCGMVQDVWDCGPVVTRQEMERQMEE